MLGIWSSLLISAVLFHSSEALPYLAKDIETSDTLAPRDTPITDYAYKYQKNCQDRAALETEAWDTAHTLASAARDWRKGDRWQSTADFWFGSNSADHYDRIMANFKNAYDFHDTRFWLTPNAPQAAFFEVWCKEEGPNGFPPRPDDVKGDWGPGAGGCTPGTNAYSYRRYSQWWLTGPVYYTVFCDNAWNESKPDIGKRTLKVIEDKIKSNFPPGKQDLLTMELPNMVRGATYLHELLHHDVVSNPLVEDVNIVGPKWFPDRGTPVYGPMWSAALAKWQGALKTGLQDPPKGGGYHGEFGTAINADNYIYFALSVYFQAILTRASPIEPADNSWKKAVKESETAPNKYRNIDKGFIVRGPDPPLDAEIVNSPFIPVADETHEDLRIDPEATMVKDQTHFPRPPDSPPKCQVPGSITTAGADPDLVKSLGATYCALWPPKKQGSPYPAQPTQQISKTLNQKNLKPTDPGASGAKLSVTFKFQPGPPLDGCFMGCEDMYPALIKTCQFDSHSIFGESMIVQECGNFTIRMNPPLAL